jgi:hypothetical protein
LNQLAERISNINRGTNVELGKTFTVSKYEEVARQILDEK